MCKSRRAEWVVLQSTKKALVSGSDVQHERPQKGRYRQFHQFGVEVLGMFDQTLMLKFFSLRIRQMN